MVGKIKTKQNDVKIIEAIPNLGGPKGRRASTTVRGKGRQGTHRRVDSPFVATTDMCIDKVINTVTRLPRGGRGKFFWLGSEKKPCGPVGDAVRYGDYKIY